MIYNLSLIADAVLKTFAVFSDIMHQPDHFRMLFTLKHCCKCRGSFGGSVQMIPYRLLLSIFVNVRYIRFTLCLFVHNSLC